MVAKIFTGFYGYIKKKKEEEKSRSLVIVQLLVFTDLTKKVEIIKYV